MKITYTKNEVLSAIKVVERQLQINRELLLESGRESYKNDILASSNQLRVLNGYLTDNADKETVEV